MKSCRHYGSAQGWQGSDLVTSLAVINCSQLVTLAGPARPRVGPELRELSIIADGAMFVEGERIVTLGARADVEPLIQSAGADCEVVDAGGRTVLPGFVDAHTHPVFAGTRVGEFEERVGRQRRIRRSPRAAAAFSRRCEQPARRRPLNWSRPVAVTLIGFCAPAPRLSRPNPVTA